MVFELDHSEQPPVLAHALLGEEAVAAGVDGGEEPDEGDEPESEGQADEGDRGPSGRIVGTT